MKHRSAHLQLIAASVLLLVAWSNVAAANQWAFIGSRHQAMGGTGVAFANDSLGAYWNPANLAWRKGYDVMLPVTIDGYIENRALEKVTSLIQQYDDVQQIFEDKVLCTSGPCTGLSNGERQDVMSFLTDLGQYGRGGEAVHANLSLGLLGGKGSWAVSAQSLSTATMVSNIDLDRLGISATAAEFLGAGTLQAPNDTALRDQVGAILGGTPTAIQQANLLVALAEQSGAQLGDPGVRSLITGIASGFGTAAGAPDSFGNNQTGAVLGGLSTQEIGFSYGLKLPVPFLHDMGRRAKRIFRPLHYRVAIGGTIKYMAGMTFKQAYRYDTDLSGADITKKIKDFGETRWTHTAGLDLAISLKPFDWLRFGMVARNVNSPEFDWVPTLVNNQLIDKIVLEPQVRLGFAFIPIKNLTFAFDFDATENTVTTLPDFGSRMISLGAEYVIPMGKRVDLALRIGGYNNVSDTVDPDWAVTGGLGLRLWNFVLDASAGASLENEFVRTGEYTFTNLPTRFNVGVTLKWLQSI
jgi:hypothetical protein